MQSDIESNPPLFFTEFSKGTPTDRQEIITRMRTNKEYAQSATQEAWYSWREKLMEPLSLSLIENVDRLKRDLKYAQLMNDEVVLEDAGVDGIICGLDDEIDALRKEYGLFIGCG